MALLDRAWLAVGRALGVSLVDSSGTTLGTGTNPLRTRPLGEGLRLYQLVALPLAAGAELSVFTQAAPNATAALAGLLPGKAVEIVSLTLSMDHDSEVQIKFRPRSATASGSTLTVMNALYADGHGFLVLTPLSIQQQRHAFLENIVYNPTNDVTGAGAYKTSLKPGVTLPLDNGGDITVLNLSATVTHNVLAHVLVRELVP